MAAAGIWGRSLWTAIGESTKRGENMNLFCIFYHPSTPLVMYLPWGCELGLVQILLRVCPLLGGVDCGHNMTFLCETSPDTARIDIFLIATKKNSYFCSSCILVGFESNWHFQLNASLVGFWKLGLGLFGLD